MQILRTYAVAAFVVCGVGVVLMSFGLRDGDVIGFFAALGVIAFGFVHTFIRESQRHTPHQ